MVVQFVVFLTLPTLICRGTDISKYFSESLGIRDNESRLYIFYFCIVICCYFCLGSPLLALLSLSLGDKHKMTYRLHMTLTLCMLGYFACFSKKNLTGIPSECQTVWIQIRPDILSGLIWVQAVCKGYQQTKYSPLVEKEFIVLTGPFNAKPTNQNDSEGLP